VPQSNLPSIEQNYEVEEILEVSYIEEIKKYKLKWKGFSENEASWETKEYLTKCADVVEHWKKSKRTLVIIKDMQKQLPLPKFNQQPTDYYRKRKLYVNNFGVYVVNTQTMHCYLWNEYG